MSSPHIRSVCGEEEKEQKPNPPSPLPRVRLAPLGSPATQGQKNLLDTMLVFEARVHSDRALFRSLLLSTTAPEADTPESGDGLLGAVNLAVERLSSLLSRVEVEHLRYVPRHVSWPMARHLRTGLTHAAKDFLNRRGLGEQNVPGTGPPSGNRHRVP